LEKINGKSENMSFVELKIPDVKIFIPKKFGDERGFFSETYSKKLFADAGIDIDFVQDNQSLSSQKGVLRGLHYQRPPFAQDKLVRVLKGSILDVAVDIRKNSPTFGQHVSAVISAENWSQILVPVGFAHGFVTLEANTEVAYKVSEFYAPDHEDGIIWNDPDLGIDWGLSEEEVQLSEKDKVLPLFKDVSENLPF